MKEKGKSTFRKIEYHRKESFYLIVRGIEVGIAAGLICVLYRFLLSKAEEYLYTVIDYVKGTPGKTKYEFPHGETTLLPALIFHQNYLYFAF